MLKPFKKADVLGVTQGFHSGHKAVDWVASYGTPLVAPERVKILGITRERFTPDDYFGLKSGYGVRMKGLESKLEYLYWHTLPIFPVWGGDTIEEGKIVAYMGNSGNVFQGGIYVPIEERTLHPHRGTHLHLEVYEKGKPIDPLPLIDMAQEPLYGPTDVLSATMRCLTKLKLLIK